MSGESDNSGTAKWQRVSGLTPGGSCRVQPDPVRSSPVPLTVRRHTEQSRAIWRQNLMDALPIDLGDEDRSKIADQLLEVAINTGNELRRKRLIDKLMHAADDLMGFDSPMDALIELLRDAAEEIRSVM